MICLRPATVDDIPILKMWDDEVDVSAWRGNDGPWDWENEIPRQVAWRESLVAELDGRPIGFIQIIDAAAEETHYWGDAEQGTMAIDIWIGVTGDRNRGFGSQMMKLAADRCFANARTTTLVIDPLESNVRACRFYERLGYQFVEKRVFGNDRCRVYRLDRPE